MWEITCLVVYAKSNKIWWCLEHVDLLFTTLRFILFSPYHYMYRFSENFGILLEHMFYVHSTEVLDILIVFAIFWEKLHWSQEHMSSGVENACPWFWSEQRKILLLLLYISLFYHFICTTIKFNCETQIYDWYVLDFSFLHNRFRPLLIHGICIENM
jgi:hypothetical protein